MPRLLSALRRFRGAIVPASLGWMVVASCGWTERLAAQAQTLGDVSIRYEIQHALDRGLDRLAAAQKEDGSFGAQGDPALTASVLLAWAGDPSGKGHGKEGLGTHAGFKSLTQRPRTSQGLLAGSRPVTSTALGILALQSTRDRTGDAAAGELRRALLAMATVPTNSGGFASGRPGDLPDIETTQQVLRALFVGSEGGAKSESKDLAGSLVRGAGEFVWQCQISNGAGGARGPKSGGFCFRPLTPAGSETNPRTALATCSGILAALYAGTPPGDPRIVAALDWLQENYTLRLTPKDPEGEFYRFAPQLAGAMTAVRMDILRPSDGRRLDWRYDLVKRLFDLQELDGSWGSGRLTEDERLAATAQAAFALEIAYHALDH